MKSSIVYRVKRIKIKHVIAGIAVAGAMGVASLVVKPTCDNNLWQHIYNPQRLHIIEQCKTVSGTVEVIRVEKDGDYHILLRTDPSLVNSVNIAKQHGDLVIEPICENPIIQQDVLDQKVCNGFSQNFHLTVGQKVTVTGAYVLDSDHGWLELHPISSIK